MPVLKHQQAAQVLKSAIVMNLADVRKEAAFIKADARQKAQAMINQALEKQQRIRDQAHQEAYEIGQKEGYDAGLQEGKDQGAKQALEQTTDELNKLQQAWLDAASSWESQRQTIGQQAHEDVLAFAIMFAKKLVFRVVQVDDQVIVHQLSQALEHVLKPMDVLVKINSEDRPVLQEALPKLMADMPHLKHVRLIDDHQISRGGCTIAYGQGSIDATLDTQIDRLVQVIAPDQSQQVLDKQDEQDNHHAVAHEENTSPQEPKNMEHPPELPPEFPQPQQQDDNTP